MLCHSRENAGNHEARLLAIDQAAVGLEEQHREPYLEKVRQLCQALVHEGVRCRLAAVGEDLRNQQQLQVYVSVCVCVCERERECVCESEKEKKRHMECGLVGVNTWKSVREKKDMGTMCACVNMCARKSVFKKDKD